MPRWNNRSSSRNSSRSSSRQTHHLRSVRRRSLLALWAAAAGLLLVLLSLVGRTQAATAATASTAAAFQSHPSRRGRHHPAPSHPHPHLRSQQRATTPTMAFATPARDGGASRDAAAVQLIDVPAAEYDGVRVHSISDIHVDYKSNLQWFKQWCAQAQAKKGRAFSVLLIPGDIASNPTTFRTAIEAARAAFDETFICAGNHDLWHSSSLQAEGVHNSLDKAEWIHRVAAEVGVRTRPCRLRTPKGTLLYIVPLLSWYHPSWDTEPDLPAEVLAALYDGRASFEQRWADFRLCKWPESLVAKEDFVSTTSKSTALADAFAAMNEPYLTSDTLLADPAARGDGTVVISFSHFLPRQELCPEKRFLIEPNLTKVIGSAPLGRQVARLRPDLHLNGHTHIPIDITLDDGIRYLQWPLGSVSEQSRQCAEMARQGPILVYEDTPGARGLAETVPTRWGEHYNETPRQPEKSDLAPWVRAYWSAGRARIR